MASATNPNGIHRRWQNSPEAPSLIGRVRHMGSAAIELVELQASLAWIEARAALARVVPAAITAAVGIALILGAIPVLLLSAADALAAATALSEIGARAIVSGSVVALALVLVIWATRRLTNITAEFEGTIGEIKRTAAWLKETSSQPPQL